MVETKYNIKPNELFNLNDFHYYFNKDMYPYLHSQQRNSNKDFLEVAKNGKVLSFVYNLNTSRIVLDYIVGITDKHTDMLSANIEDLIVTVEDKTPANIRGNIKEFVDYFNSTQGFKGGFKPNWPNKCY